MEPVFTGVGVALITLFTADGEVDVDGTAAFAQRLAGEGVASIVVGGTTGEASALTSGERADLVRAIKSAVDVPVIAGTGAASGRQAAVQTADSAAAGADALLVLSPPRVADPAAYYATVAEAAGDVPVLAYHFPAVSAPGIEIAALSSLPIVGLKDSTGDARRLLQTMDAYDGQIYSGAAPLTLYAGALGLPGMILAMANCMPQEAIAAFGGDASAQRAMTAADKVAAGEFPTGIKSLTAKAFGTSEHARLGR